MLLAWAHESTKRACQVLSDRTDETPILPPESELKLRVEICAVVPWDQAGGVVTVPKSWGALLMASERSSA